MDEIIPCFVTYAEVEGVWSDLHILGWAEFLIAVVEKPQDAYDLILCINIRRNVIVL